MNVEKIGKTMIRKQVQDWQGKYDVVLKAEAFDGLASILARYAAMVTLTDQRDEYVDKASREIMVAYRSSRNDVEFRTRLIDILYEGDRNERR